MILIIAVLAIALLIVSVRLYVLKQEVNEAYVEAGYYYDQWESELIFSKALGKEIADIKSDLKNLIADEVTEDHGTFIKHRSARKPTAETFRILFDLDTNGRKVIDDLVFRFKRNLFVSDSEGGERETARRLGRAEVVDFILKKVNVANSPNYNEALEIAYMEQQNDD